MVSIDAPVRVGKIGDIVPADPVDAAYERCRDKLGALGVSAAAFRREVIKALADDPIEDLDKRIKVEDMYLALACLVGNDKAWRMFDQAYRGYLLRLATRYAGGREAAEFSFLLSLPVILGATMVKVGELAAQPPGWDSLAPLLAGTLVAYLSGVVAIRWLLYLMGGRRLDRFAYYCWALGLVGLATFLV